MDSHYGLYRVLFVLALIPFAGQVLLTISRWKRLPSKPDAVALLGVMSVAYGLLSMIAFA